MITLLFFHLTVFSLPLWPSCQTQIISSFRNLCSKHLPSGAVFWEMWLKSKSSLNRERKKLVRTPGPPSCQPCHSVCCMGLWDRWLGWLPCESSSEESRGRVTENASQKRQWEGAVTQEGRCCPVSRAEGLRPADPENHREFRCVL